ncbi:MAG: hypothetical protein IJI25_01790 [Eubacterium sp.]|nr:hypothetical protein [Eubacterium sp.]
MKIISEVNRSVLTEYGSYQLSYELHEYESGEEDEPKVYYGIGIRQTRGDSRLLFDQCRIRGVTEEKEAACILFDRIVEGLVMPVSLPDLIEDWQSALAMI